MNDGGGYRMRSIHPLIAALREERLRQNKTQAAVARRTGWSKRTVAALERGENHPTVDFVEDYAMFLGMRLVLVKASGRRPVVAQERKAALRRAVCPAPGCGRTYQLRPNGLMRKHACKSKEEQ